MGENSARRIAAANLRVYLLKADREKEVSKTR